MDGKIGKGMNPYTIGCFSVEEKNERFLEYREW